MGCKLRPTAKAGFAFKADPVLSELARRLSSFEVFCLRKASRLFPGLQAHMIMNVSRYPVRSAHSFSRRAYSRFPLSASG